MPAIIDPFHMHLDQFPSVWSPVQWDLSPEERVKEIKGQARSSLLWNSDTPEAILRLLMDETGIERTFQPPEDYDPDQQGEWDPDIITFKFSHPSRLVEFKRESDYLYAEYEFESIGNWVLEIEPKKVTIQRI